MKKIKSFLVIGMLILICTGCNPMGGEKFKVEFKNPSAFKDLQSQVSNVSIVNDQLIISGSTLSNVSKVTLKNDSTEEVFNVEAATENQIIANGSRAFGIVAGSVFDLILADAYGSATYQVTFTVSDGAISTSKIANGAVTAAKLGAMGATAGQVLKFNGSAWVPSSITNAQIYLGTWNAATNNPDLTNPSNNPGDYFIVSNPGTFGGVNYASGDWIISDGYNWQKVANSQAVVSSFNGRRGLVTLVPGDYVSLKDTGTGKITGSSINDLADIDLAGLAANKILKYNGTKWVVADDNNSGVVSVGTAEIQDGSVTYAKANFSDGDIPQAKINGLVTALSGKEPTLTAGVEAQYYRGDKSWQTLDSAAVVENTNLYFTDARAIGAPLTGIDTTQTTAIVATDSILAGLGKAQGQLNAKASASSIVDWSAVGTPYIYPTRVYGGAVQANKTLITDAMGEISTSAVTPTELGYLAGVTSAIQDQIDNLSSGSGANQWTSDTGNIYRTSGNVGIGTTNPTLLLDIQGDSAMAKVKRFSEVNATISPGFLFVRSRGTQALPSDVQAGDWLGKVQFRGLVAGSEVEYGAFGFIAADTSGTGRFSFFDKDLTTERMVIKNDGNVGIGTTLPGTALDLNGAFSQRGMAAPALSPAGQGRIYFDSTSNTFKVSQNNGAYADLVVAGGSGVGTVTGVSSANTDISIATGTTTPVLTLNSGTGANNILKLNGDSKIPAVDGSLLTSLNPASLSGAVGVDKGGTGLTGGTSGGVPYFSSTTALASSGVLAVNGVMLGGGEGAAPTTTVAGIADQVLRIPAAGGAPVFGAIDLSKSAAVTGVLTVPNGGTGAATLTTNGILYGKGTDAIGATAAATSPSVLLSNATNVPEWTTSSATNFLQGSLTGVVFGPITNISPGGTTNFTLTQNSVIPFTSIGSGAVVNTLYLKEGKVGIGTTSPAAKLDVAGSIYSSNASGTMIIAGGAYPNVQAVDGSGVQAQFIADVANGRALFDYSGTAAGKAGNFTIRSKPNDDASIVFRIDAAGNVGIGTATPGQKLDVAGVVQATDFYYSSDRRLKENINPIEDALEKVLRLQGVTYNWRANGQADIGVIAQEVEEVFPQLVHTNPSTKMKAVEYGNLVGPIIEAIKEFYHRFIDSQEKTDREIASLKAENEELRKAVCEINPASSVCRSRIKR